MAWISHQSPTATADMPVSLSCTPCGLVDVVFATPSSPSVRATQIYGPLSGLATPPGKNSRPKGLPLVTEILSNEGYDSAVRADLPRATVAAKAIGKQSPPFEKGDYGGFFGNAVID
jgi:hypothetical protein